MYSYISGILEAKYNDYIVIDVNGIGYKIYMSQTAIENLPEIGNKVKIYTHMHVREDDISLFGFVTQEELRMFELLISVSGIGSKTAIGMLSNIEPYAFAIAVISDDVDKLTKLPGIGKKTAQRIILELKDKLKQESIETQINAKQIKEEIEDNGKVEEAISALRVLGYTKAQIDKVMEKIDVNSLSIEEIIKVALKYLS